MVFHLETKFQAKLGLLSLLISHQMYQAWWASVRLSTGLPRVSAARGLQGPGSNTVSLKKCLLTHPLAPRVDTE